MSRYRPPSRTQVSIEQAIARGEDPDTICRTLQVQPSDVDVAMRRLDSVARTDAITTTKAENVASRASYAGQSLAPCGTPAAYKRHHRHGERACDECRRAEYARKLQRKRSAAA